MAIRPVVDTVETLGKSLLLVDITKRYVKEKNENGEYLATSEFNFIYSVVCIERKFEKIDVKIPEKTALFPMDENGKAVGIPENCFVAFGSLVISPYVSKGWIQLSARAENCSRKSEKSINLKDLKNED